MVGIARTGSGKTLAFCLPAIIHIMAQPPLNHGDGPIALILSPTRELAKQVEEVARTFGKPCGIHSVAVYGGADKNSQISQLNKGMDFTLFKDISVYRSSSNEIKSLKG